MTAPNSTTFPPLSGRSSMTENTLADIQLPESGVPTEKPPQGSDDVQTTVVEVYYPSGFRLVAVVVAVVASMFLAALDMTIVATAIPRITDEFHSLDDVGWYGSAFFLTLASFQSTWGKAFKYFSLKYGVLLSIAIFELGSLICAVAPNSVTLIIGRAIAGLGAAGIASGVYTIIAFAAPPHRRPAYTGILGATYGVASVVGPLLGGVFTDRLTWRWCFYINLPIGGSAAVMIFLFFQTPEAAKAVQASAKEKLLQMDLLGTFTIMAAVICYLLALQWGGVTLPWSNPNVYGLLIGFGLLVIMFVVLEWRMGERSLILPRLLRQRTVGIASAFIFFLGGGFFLLVYYVPIYFQSIDNVSASESGVRNVPLILGVAIFSILSGHIISWWGHYVPLMVFGACLSTIGGGLLYTLDIGTSTGQWVGYQVIAGVGIGIAIQIPITAAQARVPMSDLAPVTATVLFFQTIGGALFISAGQSIFTNQLLKTVARTVPSINPTLVIATGATDLHSVFSADVLPAILHAYMDGLKDVYALAVACLGIAAVFSVFVEWRNIKGQAVAGAA
ncbi:MFS multidrug transporter [Dacryopinax primogenitus]|uniref:MFS multidrug transporter n=1 Tax=Dacryopinax primogenitus (strain DJM 731) TaxID=1858805 RepID=M5G501_DACPD|nr:MFS multidrug transporter [Dacryopinax primogenitus]EJU00927.1 MFS multidrug transporter [Dacryopinax primogenitus]